MITANVSTVDLSTANETTVNVILTHNLTHTQNYTPAHTLTQQNILNKAHQMLGITKQTYHFITDPNKRRSLYLSLVRSQFEHCSIIWRPATETFSSWFKLTSN